jgi:hypothetical protein
MSQLTPVQRQFLQQFLNVEPRPRGLFRTDEQKANDQTSTAFQKYVARKQEVTGLIDRLEQLHAVAGLVTRHRTAVEQVSVTVNGAAVGNSQAAEQTFQQAYANLERTKTTVTADIKDFRDYQAERVKVEGLQRKLIAENRAGKGPYEQPLTALLAQSATQVDPGLSYQAALQLLRQGSPAYDTQRRLLETERKKDLAAARDRPVYEDKLQRVRDGLARVVGLRGTREQQATLNGLIQRGEDAAARGDFAAAYKALEGLRPALEAAKKASDNFKRTVGTPGFRQALAAAEKQLADYRKLAGLADPEGIAAAEAKINEALQAFDAGGPLGVDAAKAEEDKLVKLTADLGKKLKAVQTAADKVEEQFGRMEKLVVEIGELAPASVVQPFADRLWSARALRGSQQYAAALIELTELRVQGTPVRTTHQDHQDRWNNRRQEIQDGAMEDLNRAINLANHVVSTQGSRLLGIFQRAENGVRDSHDYAQAAELAQQVLDGLGAVREALRAYDAMQDEFTEARTDYQERRQAIEEAIKALEDHHGDTAEAKGRLEEVQALWDAGVNELLSAEGKTVAALREAVTPRLQGILESLQADLQDEQTIEASAGRAALKTKWQEYQKAKKATDDGLLAVAVDDPAEAARLRLDYPAVPGEAADLTDEHLDRMNALKVRVLKAIKDNVVAVKGAATQAERLAAAMLQELGNLEKSFPNYKPFLANLRDEVEDCRGLIDSKALPVIREAEHRLTQTVQPKIRDLQVQNGGNAPPGTPNFKAVETKLADLKKKLKDDPNLKECLPSKLQLLQYRLEKELPGECRRVAAREALDNHLTPFETTAIDPAIAQARAARLARTQLAQTAEALKRRLAQLTDAPRLKASLEKRLAAAAKPGENGEATAKFRLDLIEKQLAAAVSGAGATPEEIARSAEVRSQLEQRAAEEEFQAQQAAQTWAAAVRIFEHNTKRGVDAVRDATPQAMRNEALYQQIGTQFDAAQAAAKAGDHAVANERLREATALASYFTANPLGARATARNNLLQVNERWKAVVSKLLRDLNELRQSIRKDVDESDPLQQAAVHLDQVNATLARVARSFDLTRFDRIIAELTNDGTNLTTRRDAKESGLRWVRNYRRLLQSDPVLPHLVANPFLKQFSLQPLSGELNNLEVNLLRAP